MLIFNIFKNVGGAMHFIYYINRLTATKVDSTYLGCLTSNAQRICPVAGLERMTTGSVVSALSYRATQVDKCYLYFVHNKSTTFFTYYMGKLCKGKI